MKFELIDTEKFRKFASRSPYKSFMQTPEIATLRENNGWTPYYFAVKEKDKIIAAAMIIAKPTFLGKSIFYSPGGPLLDLSDTKLTDFFFKNLIKYIKSHNGYVLRIDPYYEFIERNREGNKVEGGFNHQKALENLKTLGFKPVLNTDQPKYLFVLELKNRTPDQIYADFKSNTRYHIRKAEKLGVKIRELKREELSTFKRITESTAERRSFQDKPLSYYEQMYDLFHEQGKVKFIVAEANIDQEESSPTPLSVAMFILYGDEIIYLFSGSESRYMKKYNAQYLIQWHMIKYGAEKGFKKYNFYGINGLPDESKPGYGVYLFKKGFTSENTGHVVELIGSYELPLNLFYYLHSLLSKLKRLK